MTEDEIYEDLEATFGKVSKSVMEKHDMAERRS